MEPPQKTRFFEREMQFVGERSCYLCNLHIFLLIDGLMPVGSLFEIYWDRELT